MDAFWSISVYDEKGFFAQNDLDSYSINNVTAKTSADGSYTIQFGRSPPGFFAMSVSVLRRTTTGCNGCFSGLEGPL